MSTHADKTQQNQSQSAAHAEPQKQSGETSMFGFVDNRSESIAQRKIQALANSSSRVSQLEIIQAMADNSAQGRRTAQLQARVDDASLSEAGPVQKKDNDTGLPDDLKTGMENLSGFSLDDVRVHRNSDKPAQLQAHAYAQGNDIYLGAGQEKCLPHELGHVVQQKEGRVRATVQLKGGVSVNDDEGLEREADLMGERALQLNKRGDEGQKVSLPNSLLREGVGNAAQRIKDEELFQGKPDTAQRFECEKGSDPVDVEIMTKDGPLANISREVVQCEFAVEVSVGRDKNKIKIIEDIKIGERPKTQFGTKQEDHVLAWTMKINEIKLSLRGAPSLKDAVRRLVFLMVNTNAALEDRKINKTIDSVCQVYMQKNSDDLDFQQSIQKGIRKFLIAYNENPKTVRKRLGTRDRGEGARVKNAKNSIIKWANSLEKKDIKPKNIEEFSKALGDTFQYTPSSQEINSKKLNNRKEFANALKFVLISVFSMITSSPLIQFARDIACRFISDECKKIGLDKKDGGEILKYMSNDFWFRSFFYYKDEKRVSTKKGKVPKNKVNERKEEKSENIYNYNENELIIEKDSSFYESKGEELKGTQKNNYEDIERPKVGRKYFSAGIFAKKEQGHDGLEIDKYNLLESPSDGICFDESLYDEFLYDEN